MIKVGENYEIDTEAIDYSAWVWIVGKDKKTKQPKRIRKFIGYYSSPNKAIEAIINYEVHNLLGEDIESLYHAVSVIKKVHEDFKQYVKEIRFHE